MYDGFWTPRIFSRGWEEGYDATYPIVVYVCEGGGPEIEIYVAHEEPPTTQKEGKEKGKEN